MDKKSRIIENARQLCANGSTVAGLMYAYKEGMLEGKRFVTNKLKNECPSCSKKRCVSCNKKTDD